MLRRSAKRHGDKPAIVCATVSWSYAELDTLVDQLASGLVKAGIARGERVGILARNSHAFVAVRFAVARMAAVLVPVNFMLNAEEVAYILEHSGASHLFVDASTVDTALAAAGADISLYGIPGEDSAIPEHARVTSWEALFDLEANRLDAADTTDLLQIIYTSGTESRPKGAMLTHDAVLWEYQSCVIDCEWTPDAIALHSLPLFHCAQLDAMLGPSLQVGGTNIITSSPAPENLIPMLSEHRVNSFFCPPTVWISLLRSELFDRYDLSALNKGYYGASIMPVEVLREILERLPGIRLWNLYGQTEIAPVATVLFPEEHADRCGSAGRPALHVDTRVVDDDMRDVAPGGIGEVVHRSPQLLAGYWRNEEATAAAFSGGWFHSGDLATIDEEGYITIVDRKKDMIKTGGENVSSREVEEAIYQHPAVSEVAVIGLPHERWIEAVTAVVVPKAGQPCDENELIAFCAARIARFKVPKRVIFTATLPRNASGKILKRQLRHSLADSFT